MAAVTPADHANTVREDMDRIERILAQCVSADEWGPEASRIRASLDALQAQAEESTAFEQAEKDANERAEAAEAERDKWYRVADERLTLYQAADAERDRLLKTHVPKSWLEDEQRDHRTTKDDNTRLRERIDQAVELLNGIDYEEGSRIDRAIAALAGEDA